MANVRIDNTVTLHKDGSTFTVGELREFLEAVREFGSNTRVRVTAHNGQRDPFIKLESRYGDTE